MLFVDAFGYDVNGQAVGLDDYALQVAAVHNSRQSIQIAGADISAHGRRGQVDARNEENVAGGLNETLLDWILGYVQLRRNRHIAGQTIELDASI